MKRSIRWGVLGVLVLSVAVLSLSITSSAQIGIGIGISVRIGPPALPVYAQPICPGPGYLWTPGYWAWSDDGGYYWVPGTWVVGPVGMLWTPGYWGFADGLYGWHAGYWGPHVGFYGGINYGFGFGGVGFAGGEWRGDSFFYNRAVMNVNVTNVTNVYTKTVVVNNTHVAFNGPGGVEARPTAQEEMYAHESHTPALAAQTEHAHAASQNKQLFASANHGRPAIAATAKPGDFSGRSVTRASAAGGAYHAPKMTPQQARASEANHGAEPARSEPARSEPARNEPARNNEPAKREPAAHAERPAAAAHTDRPAAATHADRPAAAAHTDRPAAAAHTDRPAAAAHTDRPATRPENKEARTSPARGNEARSNEARSNETHGSAGAKSEPKPARESAAPAKQHAAAAPKKAAPKPAKSEPKGNTKEEKHR